LTPSVLSGIQVAAWFGLMFALRRSGFLIALISLAATVLHEACHLLVGLVLNAKPQSVTILPKREGRHWVLGAVSFANLNLWNSAFVALAPLAMLPLGAWAFQAWMVPALAAGDYGSWALAGYIVACCVFGGLPSTTDIRLGAASALVYVLLAGAAWWIMIAWQ
jgi:hypothetical protein